MLVELLRPNKSDAIAYLDSGAAAPARYARAIVQFGATPEPYIQEYVVGPLPVANGTTTFAKLDHIYNKGKGYQRIYDSDIPALLAFVASVGAKVADITQLLFNGVSMAYSLTEHILR